MARTSKGTTTQRGDTRRASCTRLGRPAGLPMQDAMVAAHVSSQEAATMIRILLHHRHSASTLMRAVLAPLMLTRIQGLMTARAKALLPAVTPLMRSTTTMRHRLLMLVPTLWTSGRALRSRGAEGIGLATVLPSIVTICPVARRATSSTTVWSTVAGAARSSGTGGR